MSPSILVIDDSITVRRSVQTTLGGAGYELAEAHDGAQGIQRLHELPSVRLVICDVHMPRMGGLEFLRIVKAAAASRDVDVVMLTSTGAPDDIRQAREAGARAWLMKPFKPAVLLATVEKLLASGVPLPEG